MQSNSLSVKKDDGVSANEHKSGTLRLKRNHILNKSEDLEIEKRKRCEHAHAHIERNLSRLLRSMKSSFNSSPSQ